jgi:ribokinase
VGVVGGDGIGHDILSTLCSEGIDTAALELRADVSSSVCVCFVGANGENSIVWHIDDEVAVRPDTVRSAAPVIQQADAVLITFEMPPESIRAAINATHGTGSLVIVQPAPQLANPTAAASLPWDLADVVVANETEARALLNGDRAAQAPAADELATALAAELKVPVVVVTLGQGGCVLHREGVTHRYLAEKVPAIDTTGAGDTFTANLAAGLTAGVAAPEAIYAAQSAAAQTVRRMGSYEAISRSDCAE